jgi:hypothetical protein
VRLGREAIDTIKPRVVLTRAILGVRQHAVVEALDILGIASR